MDDDRNALQDRAGAILATLYAGLRADLADAGARARLIEKFGVETCACLGEILSALAVRPAAGRCATGGD